MKTYMVQKNMFTGTPGFSALVARRLGSSENKMLRVSDVAAVLDVGRTKVLELIECGRLAATNMNRGIEVPVDPERPDRGTRPLMPLWRITHEAVMDLARSMEEGL